MKERLLILCLIFFAGFSGKLSAQQVEYTAEIDTNYMMIGDQIGLTIKVKADPGATVTFPLLKDTVSRGLEIISGPQRDSVPEKDGRYLVTERYLITAFDTGVYHIPSMPIRIERNEYTNLLHTDPLGLIVNTYVIDEEKGNYDIVMPMEAPWTFAEILPYLLWGLLGLAVVGAVVLLIWRIRSKKPLFAASEPVVPPYELAIKALDEIRNEKLWQQGKTKEYYTLLTEALRNYMEGELEVPAMEQTSWEILRALEAVKVVGQQDRKRLADLLETADLVKFAKAAPLPDENARNLDVAYDFVNHTNEQVEQTREEIRKAEEISRKEAAEAVSEEDAAGN